MTQLNLINGRRERQDATLLPFEEQFINTIQDVDEYCHKRGEIGGLDTGFPQMTEALEGLQSGLTLIAGAPNTGKSALTMQLALQIAQRNDNTYCIYHSLDDNMREMLPRAVATLQRLPINAVKFPARYQARGETNILTRRKAGLNQLVSLASRFGIRDESYDGNGAAIESIEKSVKDIKFHAPDKQIVLFIDNFHDLMSINMSAGDADNSKFNYLAGEISRLATQYDLPIVCTAEFRKLNGYRRPTVDDVRETVKIGYESKAILLCYNEVGLKGEASSIAFDRPDKQGKQPILEVKYGKNKYSSFKGRLFYNFYTEQSYLQEVPPAGVISLNGIISS